MFFFNSWKRIFFNPIAIYSRHVALREWSLNLLLPFCSVHLWLEPAATCTCVQLYTVNLSLVLHAHLYKFTVLILLVLGLSVLTYHRNQTGCWNRRYLRHSDRVVHLQDNPCWRHYKLILYCIFLEKDT